MSVIKTVNSLNDYTNTGLVKESYKGDIALPSHSDIAKFSGCRYKLSFYMTSQKPHTNRSIEKLFKMRLVKLKHIKI